MDKQEIKNVILEMGARARAAAHALTILSADKKNEILRAMAASMREQEGGYSGGECSRHRRW